MGEEGQILLLIMLPVAANTSTALAVTYIPTTDPGTLAYHQHLCEVPHIQLLTYGWHSRPGSSPSRIHPVFHFVVF